MKAYSYIDIRFEAGMVKRWFDEEKLKNIEVTALQNSELGAKLRNTAVFRL